MREPEEDDGLESHHLCFLLCPLEANGTAVGDKAEGNTGAGGEERGDTSVGLEGGEHGLGVGTSMGLEGGEAPGAGEGRGDKRAIW
jgi:hypothetical protein